MTGEKLLKFYNSVSVSVHTKDRIKSYLGLEMDFDEIIKIFKTSHRIQRDEMYASGFRPRDRKDEYTWFFGTKIRNTFVVFVAAEATINEQEIVIKTVYVGNRQNNALCNGQYNMLEQCLLKR